MKTIIYAVFLTFGAILHSQTEYVIQGTVSSPPEKEGEVVLSIYDPIHQTKTKIATAVIEDKQYNIRYPFVHPDLFTLDFPWRQTVYLVIDKGQSAIEVSTPGEPSSEVSITGSQDSKLLLGYEQFRKASGEKLITPTYEAMTKASKENDTKNEIAAVENYVRNSKLHREELIDYIEGHIGTSIALYGTALRWTGDDAVPRLSALVSAFAKKHPDLPMTEVMQQKVERYKKVAIGAKVANIVSKTPNGEPIDLYQELGTYTLIDFWASWCRPCILQIPDLQKAYKTFKQEGFKVFSYSVDRSSEKWNKAIAKYDMPWLHASDAQGWQSQVASDYNVTFVPFNLLIDAQGKIVAKNIHHKTLYDLLEALYKYKNVNN